MPNAGAQSIWLAGSRFFFQRDAITVAGAPVIQPIIDFGTIMPVSPTVTPTPIVLKDSESGSLRDIAEQVSEISETYEIKTNNMNMDIWAHAFMADPLTGTGYDVAGSGATTQAVTPVTNVPHVAVPGKLMKLLDASGYPIFGITSIQAIHVGTTSGTAAAVYNPTTGIGDYSIVSLERGLIKWWPSSALVTANTAVFVDYTPRAVTGFRTVFPQTQGCTSTGVGILIWNRCGYKEQSARIARFSLTPKGSAIDVSKWSELSFGLRVLYDPTLSRNPAGSFNYWLGDLPLTS